MPGRTFELEFAKFIERFRDQIMESFLEDTFNRRDMFSHSPPARQFVEDNANTILSEFTKNIDRRTAPESIADEYVRHGLRYGDDGLSLSEMLRVFILLKRHIWIFFQESDFAGQPFDVRSIVALNNRTTLFFDRVMYYFSLGYEESQIGETTELDHVYELLLDKLRRDLGLPERAD